LTALAAVTERLRLGTLVSPATFRHPSELARVAVTADHVSGGRVEVGIGAGWFELEHRQNGFPFPPVAERFDRFGEYVEVVVGSWGQEPFDFAGQYFSLEAQRALPSPVQRPHPPVILGGRAKDRSLALAARFATEYNVAFVGLEDVGPIRGRVDKACTEAGRDPAEVSLSLMTLVALGVDAAGSDERLATALTRFRGPASRCLAGTVDEMAQRLGEYEAAGVSRVYLQHPDRQDFEAIELMGELARAVSTDR
jgi:alkanesulfonate monooxygenase SsuD/methylene tetrahydromethanopterin reductase-like flavin-dependent oxidoreductase (luciferase family)